MTERTKIDIGHDMVIQSSSVALRVNIGLPSNGHWLAMSRSQAEKALPILQRFVDTGSIDEPKSVKPDHPFRPQPFATGKCNMCNGLIENHATVCDHDFRAMATNPSMCAHLIGYRICGRPMEQHVKPPNESEAAT